MMATDNYYAPAQQKTNAAPGADQMPAYTPIQQNAPDVEETFGARASAGGYQGMQPEDVPPNLPITEEPAAQTIQETQPGQMQPEDKPEASDVDVTMVEL